MGSVASTVEQKLAAEFAPQRLDVINESHMHSGPKDAESHFKVIIVSDAFEGVRPVARHQMVYRVLADELANGIHALSLTLMTQAEWHKDPSVIPSPSCMGKRPN
ncbi:MAG: BolA family protein [Cellvibrio sp.]